MATAEDKKYFEEWQKFRDNTRKATPIDLNETVVDRQNRIAKLEKDPEAWFKYYFPNFYTSEPAPFHIRATRRILNNPEWYAVRSWSRELSKTGRTMMEVLYLVMTGKKKNILMVSSTYDNAVRFLLPYKVILEVNNRIITDYGDQETIGNWEAGEFVTKKGVSFRALGAGQSPRGTRKDEVRPDAIIIDDIDTDEECRNPSRIKEKVKWIEEALYGTRSISNPLLFMVNGNIIAKYCCVTELAKVADEHEIINIRDKNGVSTWPAKNTEALIDRALSKISWSAQQKEYFNNPVSSGDVFKTLKFDKCPPLKSCDAVIAYADPSTSNKDRGVNKQASYKSVGVIGRKGTKYYLYKVWLRQTNNSTFVSFLFQAYKYMELHGVDVKRVAIENNSLQDPHYEQVIMPEIKAQGKAQDLYLPVTPDKRKKGDKFDRIEGNLEPKNRLGNLIFNIDEKNDPDMKVMEEQMLGVAVNAKMMDGPDMLEGGTWMLENKTLQMEGGYAFGSINSRRF
ncbi:hypothetical protein FNO01nite_30410 [Flavobacterium noncentrifugens]|uniref:Terminase-like family protein n=1 Tax=Flavobacterium noncentrifugens TaxID=1128970 RepID=A0A1G9BVJ6_9FLAO|nr:hypothetical protein [Flavobacterium noncentrifugens]GEP52369.1 hypothetical protein FNO01nite_30410 [Flavobacterium noncentrifugens]SDK42985.1 hypothetical protein SAMN04487935_3354 [Flavobacterium noncentrifugens]